MALRGSKRRAVFRALSERRLARLFRRSPDQPLRSKFPNPQNSSAPWRHKKTGFSSQGMTVRTRGIFESVQQWDYVGLPAPACTKPELKSIGHSKNSRNPALPEILLRNLRAKNHRSRLLSSEGRKLLTLFKDQSVLVESRFRPWGLKIIGRQTSSNARKFF